MSRVIEWEQKAPVDRTNAGLGIRRARSSDFSAVFDLLGQLWSDRNLNREKILEIFRTGLSSTRAVYLCLHVDDRILGFCSLKYIESFWIEGTLAYITEMVVDKNFRGRGYGALFLRHVLDLCKRQGCVSTVLDSDFGRINAHKFYAKMGFKKTGFFFMKDLKSF